MKKTLLFCFIAVLVVGCQDTTLPEVQTPYDPSKPRFEVLIEPCRENWIKTRSEDGMIICYGREDGRLSAFKDDLSFTVRHLKDTVFMEVRDARGRQGIIAIKDEEYTISPLNTIDDLTIAENSELDTIASNLFHIYKGLDLIQ